MDIHVGGRIMRGSLFEYVNGVVAMSKVDPDNFNFHSLLDVIDGCGYGLKDNISIFYRMPLSDTSNGLVELKSHTDVDNMFAVHAGSKNMFIEIYVDCPNVVDSEDENEVDPSSLTEVRAELRVGEEGNTYEEGDEHIEQQGAIGEGERQGDEGVDASEMNESSDSDCDWEPNDDSSSSCPSFSGVEESSGGEEEENIPVTSPIFNLNNNSYS